jgi:hypothetical protein
MPTHFIGLKIQLFMSPFPLAANNHASWPLTVQNYETKNMHGHSVTTKDREATLHIY